MSNEANTMDGHSYSGAAADMISGMVYSRLVKYKRDWSGVDPDLAESWTVQDNKVYTFKLRQGVKFHDGSTDDGRRREVQLRSDHGREDGAYIRPLILSSFDKIEVVDPQTVRITLKQVNAAFLAALAMPTASIVSKKFIEGGGDLTKTMMGTGPMKFVSKQPNVETKLVKHTEYWDAGQAVPGRRDDHPDQRRDRPLDGPPQRLGRLHRLRALEGHRAISADQNLKVYGDTESSGIWLFFKVTAAPLDNVKVRQAINYAVDRDAIVKATFFGHGAPMNDLFMPKTHWAYVKDIPGGYSYDPAKAKQLLAEAGFPNGFKIKMLSTHEVSAHKSGAEIVQANLSDVGIEIDMELVDLATDVKRYSAGDYDIIMWGGGPLYGEVDFLSGYFRSGNAVPKNTGYSNPELDKLLDDARATLDQEQRKGLYRKAFDILLADAPWVPLAYREQGEAAAATSRGTSASSDRTGTARQVAMTWLDK